MKVNSSKKHPFATFSFRKPKKTDRMISQYTDPITGNSEMVVQEVTLPVLKLHRNHFAEPTDKISRGFNLPGARRAASIKCRTESILFEYIGWRNEHMRLEGHEARMERQRLAGNRRREGLLN